MKPGMLFFGLLFVASYMLTWLIRRIALRKKILDIPNERSSHLIPTPRGGGMAIVILWFLGITILYFSNQLGKDLYLALLSGIILAIVSFIDDIASLKPGLRLIFQFLTAIIAFILMGGIKPVILFNNVTIPALVAYPVTVIGIVWFINLYNFLDGIDGYASIQAIFAASALYLFAGNPVTLVLIACTLGFLVWNWPKAKVFMGDVGSTQIGFILVVLGLYFHNTTDFSIILWVILLSPFWFDATFTLFRRWRNREKLSQAHRKHAYQRFVQAGHSHLVTDIWLIIINIIVGSTVALIIKFSFLMIPILFADIIFLYVVTKIVDRKVPFK